MPSFGSYLLGAAQLAVLARATGYAAWILRARLLPGWRGAPARLVEVTVAVGLLTVVSEVLGTFGLLYAGALILAMALVAFGSRLVPPAPGRRPDRARRRPRRPRLAGGDRGDRDRRLRLGGDGEARARRGHLQLRLALVPHAVLGGHGPVALDDRDAPHRNGVRQLVLPAELRAPARGRDPRGRPGHPQPLHQLRLARGRLPRRLLRGTALRARRSRRRSSPRSWSAATPWWCASRARRRTT